ncbi:period circadian protein homolog 2-like, partial [Nannospalax galili]|uniref:period circadian protein homolog 2-like n=1 Tax=Nannospalax galili TaxID=1026970 RepID=UPI000819BD5A
FTPEPDMNGYSNFSPSPGSPTKESVEPQPSQAVLQEDVDMSSGSSGHENCSMGRDSQGSDCDDNGKELRMLVEPSDTHSSPDAFRLMMTEPQHNPSTSGC